MERNVLVKVIPDKSGKYASLERKIIRYACDPNRYYNAGGEVTFGPIKAVRLG
jgi:hypothetical protein